LKIRLFSLALLLFLAVNVLAQTNSSLYTPLAEKQCKAIKGPDPQTNDYEGRCRGVGGYTLIVTEGDLRQNVTVVTPKGAKHSLELWDVISGGFSSVGAKAEWRMAKQDKKLVPVALIIRYNANEDPESPNKQTSYLAVTKITDTEVCVTDKVNPGANANEDARRAADDAVNKPCLKKNQPQQ
jgi:hypothetical protein